ncbi:MAG: hypothetical protein K1X66_00270 [Verrucomicrobiae bacterium]|nr:hypothetical protein [Verrucomicrobiae bacterium]
MNHENDQSRKEERFELKRLGGKAELALIFGLLCLGVSFAWGCWKNPTQLAFSWLIGFIYFFSLCAGSLFWILLHHATNSGWSVVVRRFLENVAGLFPFLMILFIPILFYGKLIYEWMRVDPKDSLVLANKAAFLNQPFYYGRVVFYFFFFCVVAWLFKYFSKKQDREGAPYLSVRMRHMSYIGMLLFALTLTFFAFDHLMALDYHWYSTMWGVYIFAGAGGAAMALLILVSNAFVRAGYLKDVFTKEHNHLMGKLLFAFTVFWAYISFSQYFLIYYANIPEETLFYVYRNTGGWFWVSVGLAVFRFIVPFLLLLTQPAKTNPKRLCFSAGLILVMHFVDVFWIIAPQQQLNEAGNEITASPHIAIHVLDFLIPLGFLGILGYLFLRATSRGMLYPWRDPRLTESIGAQN